MYSLLNTVLFELFIPSHISGDINYVTSNICLKNIKIKTPHLLVLETMCTPQTCHLFSFALGTAKVWT